MEGSFHTENAPLAVLAATLALTGLVLLAATLVAALLLAVRLVLLLLVGHDAFPFD